MDKLYTIQEVATRLGLADKTLRRWEDAGRFTPSRTLGNQRRYSIEDLQILDALKHGTFAEQKDLLTIEQAGLLCGVSPTTITRWENDGKIHPFITSGHTFYPRQKLLEKMDELKKIYAEPAPLDPITPPPAPVEANPASPATNNEIPKLTILDTRARSASPLQFNVYLTNALVTLILILSYHLIFNASAAIPNSPDPISPTGSVQGASAINVQDPRLDDLIVKFQDHLQTEMLKNAAPTTTTIKVGGSELITGASTLPKGKDQIKVENDKIVTGTPVTVTFNSDYSPAKKYWVTADPGSFTLHTDFPVGADTSFYYNFIASSSATTNY